MLKRGRCVEFIPYVVLELILEKLPLKSLKRLKSVSKMWKSIIESSQQIHETQLIHRKQSRGPDILFVRLSIDDGVDPPDRKIVLASLTTAATIRFPISGNMFCYGSCDGLLCIYNVYGLSFVVNPTTRWLRTFPFSGFQKLLIQKYDERLKNKHAPIPKLGFGRDKSKGIYKPVWLYNSSQYGLDNVTTCEVFDFSINVWRYVVPASLYRINAYHKPVYLEGSLYWFTEARKNPKILTLDLHTEKFEVMCKAPPFSRLNNPYEINMCILDECLCVSEKIWSTQVIWSFNSNIKKWKKLCSIDLTKTISWFGKTLFPLLPITIVEKNKLMFQGSDPSEPVVIHDLLTKSYALFFRPIKPVASVYYYQSLFSALSN